LEIFNTKLASQQHQHKANISTTSTRSWKSSAQRWHHNNISMNLEIFSTRLASQKHQHEAENLQHKADITTTSERSWKYSTQSWHLNNISMKLEIFSIRLASQQHQYEARNIQHKFGIHTTSPFEGGPFRLHQACLESSQTLHEIEAWSTHLQPIHPCQHNGSLWLLYAPYHEWSDTISLCASTHHGTHHLYTTLVIT
jgi:hypothetical protein